MEHLINLDFFFSNVPTANDVLVPETLLKKNKADAKAAEAAVTKKAELRKASIKHTSLKKKRKKKFMMILWVRNPKGLDCTRCCLFVNHLSGLITFFSFSFFSYNVV
jgi:hypothetical protein